VRCHRSKISSGNHLRCPAEDMRSVEWTTERKRRSIGFEIKSLYQQRTSCRRSSSFFRPYHRAACPLSGQIRHAEAQLDGMAPIFDSCTAATDVKDVANLSSFDRLSCSQQQRCRDCRSSAFDVQVVGTLKVNLIRIDGAKLW
jgi:hypothetical protein